MILLGVLLCVQLVASSRLRIIGGTVVPTGTSTYAHTVRIEVGTAAGNERCAGSIIAKNYILTAAHCVRKISSTGSDDIVSPDKIAVFTGRSATNPDATYAVEATYIQSSYAPATNFQFRTDIAVLKLKTDIVLSDPNVASIIPLALSTDLFEDNVADDVYASGFGATVSLADGSSPSTLSAALLYVQLPIALLGDCQAAAAAQSTFTAPTTFCAGGLAGLDACGGDSGGPLVYRPMGVPQLLIGVTQAGTSSGDLVPMPVAVCGAVGEYGVFTSVAQNRDWIDSVLNGNVTALATSTSTPTSSSSSSTLFIGSVVILFMALMIAL